jgi:hypothetical protein
VAKRDRRLARRTPCPSPFHRIVSCAGM